MRRGSPTKAKPCVAAGHDPPNWRQPTHPPKIKEPHINAARLYNMHETNLPLDQAPISKIKLRRDLEDLEPMEVEDMPLPKQFVLIANGRNAKAVDLTA
jgi:hypothetical protein